MTGFGYPVLVAAMSLLAVLMTSAAANILATDTRSNEGAWGEGGSNTLSDEPAERVSASDTLGDEPAERVSASDTLGDEPAERASASDTLSDQEFLEEIQRLTFGYFWETTNPENGLTPDRWPTRSFASIAAVGFALTAYPIGVERGYVSRQDAAQRTLRTLEFFWNAPHGEAAAGVAGHRGFYYHFLDVESGARFETVELSSIDTALLMAGVLLAAQYFDGGDASETRIRSLADSLYLRVEWDWMQPRPPLIGMAWYPERGFGPPDYRGFNEAMILYILALGSPTHAIDEEVWDVYTSTYLWDRFYGREHLNFSPLFGHQYSHVWIDYRGIQDAFMREKGIDYFENSRRAALAQRQYAIDNPNRWKGYGPDVWGLTASDGPLDTTMAVDGVARRFHTYWARGASAEGLFDDGTIAPTAVGGSVPFAPEVAVPALKAMRDKYGEHLFGRYGFLDAFNPTFDRDVRVQHGKVVPGVGWFDTDYLGIDQGPILAMIENHRTEFVWQLMRENAYVVRGLCRAGFTGGWLEGRCD